MNTVENIEVYSPECLALADHLECDRADLDECTYNHNGLIMFKYGSQEYAIGTDEEADKATLAYIQDSVWAFNASFLADFTGIPVEAFEAMQGKCEDANDPILKIIQQGDGMEYFAEQATMADGRGHFLSPYDGEEHWQGEYFIYRIN